MQLTHKIAVAAGALTLAATGVAAADSPPDAADHGLSTASEQVGVDLPAAKDAHPEAPEVQDEATDDTSEAADAEDQSTADEIADEGIGPVDNHGAEVSVVAQSDATVGREHGEAVSEVARQGHGEGAGTTGDEHRADHGRP